MAPEDCILVLATKLRKNVFFWGGGDDQATRNDVMQVGEASNAIQQPQQPTKVHLVSSLNAPLCKGIGKAFGCW